MVYGRGCIPSVCGTIVVLLNTSCILEGAYLGLLRRSFGINGFLCYKLDRMLDFSGE
jgi:hypothetical protein